MFTTPYLRCLGGNGLLGARGWWDWGLGLGLVISAQLVRAAGGTLRAANRVEGGACFTVELPIVTPQGQSQNE